LFVLIGLSVIGLAYSWMPLIFKFQKENSNDVNNQLFWLSMFSGILTMVIYFAR
jgi:energy-converting hydrogenase B subunit G